MVASLVQGRRAPNAAPPCLLQGAEGLPQARKLGFPLASGNALRFGPVQRSLAVGPVGLGGALRFRAETGDCRGKYIRFDFNKIMGLATEEIVHWN